MRFCFVSHLLMKQVKADTVLIESDKVARAILDVIPILNIRKLVLGVNRSRYLSLDVKANSSAKHTQVFVSIVNWKSLGSRDLEGEAE